MLFARSAKVNGCSRAEIRASDSDQLLFDSCDPVWRETIAGDHVDAITTEALTRVLSGRLSASRAAALVLMAGWGGAGLGGILAGLVAAAYGVAGVLWASAGLLVVAYVLYLCEPALRARSPGVDPPLSVTAGLPRP